MVRTRAVTPSAPSARNLRRAWEKGDMCQSPPVGGPADEARLEEIRRLRTDASLASAPLRHGFTMDPMGAIRRMSFDDPDGLREFPLMTVSLARFGSHTIGRGVVQPGWHWTEHLGPVMRADSCPLHHV